MTTQTLDVAILFKQRGWNLLGEQDLLDDLPEAFPVANPDSICTPSAFGLQPKAWMSSCWKGYEFTVSIDQTGLHLQTLEVWDERDEYPEINGKGPSTIEGGGRWRYERLDLKLPFSGIVRVGFGFMSDVPAPMYLTPPHTFRHVLDIEFAAGELVGLANRTAHFAEYRKRYRSRLS